MSVRAKRTARVEAESAIHAFTKAFVCAKAIMAPLTIRDAALMEAPGAIHSPYMVASVLVYRQEAVHARTWLVLRICFTSHFAYCTAQHMQRIAYCTAYDMQ